MCLEINVWFYYSTSVQSYLNKGLLVESHQLWDSEFDSTNLIVLIFLLNLVEMHPDPKQVDQTILISQIMSQMLTQASSYYILDSIFYTEILSTLINHISTLIQHIWLVLHNYSVSLKANVFGHVNLGGGCAGMGEHSSMYVISLSTVI